MYSLWLTPPKGDVHQTLQTTIRHFSQKYTAPVFSPHVTLVGDAGPNREKAVEAARRVVQSRKV